MTAPSAAPPVIPEHEHVSYVSSGGFGDVFVYRDNIGREVAIKVLHLRGLTLEAKEAFKVEAARMASIRSRFVVTVYGFGIAGDGRPYISMEYCSESLAGRIAHEPLTVSDAIRTSIQVASAVAAAHAAGLSHRDIKPANVLLTHDGTPALTDFGIAGGRGASDSPSRGLSLRYAAPEVIAGDTDGDELADVYSLGATTYALLTGHAPHDIPGGDNSEASLIQRTLSGRMPQTRRGDVPESLERVLAHALARDPEARFPSAAAFVRALQEIEVELGFSRTEVPLGGSQVVSAPSGRDASTDPDEGTRMAPPQRVDPLGAGSEAAPHNPEIRVADRTPTVRPSTGRPATSDAGAQDSNEGQLVRASDATFVREGAESEATGGGGEVASVPPAKVDKGDSDGRHRSRLPMLVTSVVVLGALVAAVVSLGGREPADEIDHEPVRPPDGAADGGLFAQPTVPLGVVVRHTAEGVVVEWDDDPEPTATYVVSVTAGPEEGHSVSVEEPRAVLEATDQGVQVCVRVLSVVGGVSSEPSREECTR